MSLYRLSQHFLMSHDTLSTVAQESDQREERRALYEQIDAVKFLGLGVQLGLLVLVIRQFQLESSTFLQIVTLAWVGFSIHYFLPFQYRLSFFLALSFTGIWLVFGFTDGAWLIGVSLALIGVCYLPIAFSLRAATLCLIGTLLAFLRVEWVDAPWSSALWPILGSMLMFRLILYLYDSRHETTPAPLAQVLSYFFLLPNICFPLFPVVDYKTFRRTYYNDDRHRIYQEGVQWIGRGITQLILYRFIYYYLSRPPSEVMDLGDLVRYILSGFLLYLRISSQFHIIVGMLHLFGFNLPETHRLYFLASSFTDFWRRINIYWKDFMMKIFYYPAYFALRKLGATTALVLSTLWVFFATWVLHAYQWFWIRGSFLFAWNDGLFWVILALLVVGNTLYETRYGRKRTLGKTPWTLAGDVTLILRTAGTFIVISILWSLWTSESLSEWFALWLSIGELRADSARFIIAFILGSVFFGMVTVLAARRGSGQRLAFSRSAALVSATMLFLYLLGSPEVYSSYLFSKTARAVVPQLEGYVQLIASLREAKLNHTDVRLLERGYYENLLSGNRLNSQVWGNHRKWSADWLRLEYTAAARMTRDLLKYELVPSTELHFENGTLRTNRWGMRDKDYEQLPPSDTHRIALLGSSHVMGYGIEEEETFATLLENRLNQEAQGQSSTKYEILNFSVNGYTPLQELAVLEDKVFSFAPQLIFLVAHANDEDYVLRYLEEMIRTRVDVRYAFLKEIMQKAGVDGETSKTIALRRLRPFGDEILVGIYQRMVELCRQHGVTPLWIYMPTAGDGVSTEFVTKLIQRAERAGFTTLDLSDAYKGYDSRAIWLVEWDHHPNALGHRLVADKLYSLLRAKGEQFALNLVP